MRSPMVCEVVLLARVLTRIAPAERNETAGQLLSDTDKAEVYLKESGHCHSVFGDGSLMSRCLRLSPPAEPMADDPEFLACLITAAHSIFIHSRR